MKSKDCFRKKVFEYMEQNRMLRPGDRVAVGVSGGADSVCLLFLLEEYRGQVPFEMRVIHVHHGIRADAGKDAEYVESLCERLGVPCKVVKADVPKIARAEGLSEEEAGRKARYEAFERAAYEWALSAQTQGQNERDRECRLALAHHMGDRAETMLFHLFRGTGIRGLSGIQPIREHLFSESLCAPHSSKAEEIREGNALRAMTVIRPLLCAERGEIEAYLAERGIAYCQDSTNQEDDHARNRIRHHILPYAQEQICEGAVRHMNRTAQQLSETEQYLALQTAQAVKLCVEGTQIRVQALFAQHPLIRKRILWELLLELCPGHQDIGAVHVEALLRFCGAQTGKELSLPMGILARKSYDVVVLERTEEQKNGENPSEGLKKEVFLPKMQVGEVYEEPFEDCLFRFQILKNYKFCKIPENQYTKWFDYGKIKGALSIRTRRTGDYLVIRGGEGKKIRKKIKDYLITEKIPAAQRDSLPLLAQGDQILWIAGYRISEACKVDENTQYILQAELVKNGGERNGGTCGSHVV